MKGIIFTELIEMIETKHGFGTLNRIIEKSKLESNGIYTSVGTYPFSELQSLITNLSMESGVQVDQLIFDFGKHLFHRFAIQYPEFIERYSNSFELLRGIDNHIHQEVKKLYPDAELPVFEHNESGSSLTLLYTSNRKLFNLAHGLIEGCSEHFGENIALCIEKLSENQWQFKLSRNEA